MEGVMKRPRASGILLHPTSLPGRFGIGDLGSEAYKFVDFLEAAGQSLWQIMPLGPTGYGDSPYQSFSAFAGNTLLVSPERLVADELLSEVDLEVVPDFSAGRVEYGNVIDYKRGLLHKAFDNFKRGGRDRHRSDYDGFLHFAASWLDDYALFSALKDEHHGASWHTWQKGIAAREPGPLATAGEAFRERIEAHKFFQYLFFKQWLELKRYCGRKGVRVVGDMPIFVAHNSADVWAQPHLFKLREDGSPRVVAGVPPDAFSATGQLWGNPIYDWERMRGEGFGWWVERMRFTLNLVDIVRVDHFRGFAAAWEVPADDETAEHGRWVGVPGRELFAALKNSLGDLPIMAEDLGTITPDVHALRDEFSFPGMRVLQFAFGGDPHDTHLPHNYVHHAVVYTGTHDNDTTAGWFNSRNAATDSAAPDEALRRERENCLTYLGGDGREIHWDFIRAALASVADTAIIPLQDVLGLDSSARMNTPASTSGNWAWRFGRDALTGEPGTRLRELTRLTARLPADRQADASAATG
jgi:4-alpha-glucanotransferase